MNDRQKAIEFIQVKIVEAEKALKAREQMQRIWREGTDESWAAAANAHPSTKGQRLTKAERLKESESHGRIAVKCRLEVEMFKLVLTQLT